MFILTDEAVIIRAKEPGSGRLIVAKRISIETIIDVQFGGRLDHELIISSESGLDSLSIDPKGGGEYTEGRGKTAYTLIKDIMAEIENQTK